MPAPRQTKPRERLKRDDLAAGALALADREGLEAVTIRRLAADNMVTPMALYWHFSDKDALFDAIAERIYAEITLPALPEAGGLAWHEDLHAVLTAALDALRAHPLAVMIVAPAIMKSEAGLELAERTIGLLRAAGFSAASAAQTGMFLLCSLVNLVDIEPGSDRRLDSDTQAAHLRSKRAQLESLDPKRFASVLETAEFFLFCPSEDEYFSRGIDFLVAGAQGTLPA
ncbi:MULTISPECIES: TetR/AcrR family transcriptional regulator [Subtercola]|uniref:TetR/AcrR family transcriptional regulator n=1 Tax=Subtercola vilae TaxID=2056433 RepID=A0A4T2C0E9_9MICO|nr:MULTISPECIES: TetR/AcrR family transcriptional regulator [Subtercola]MEA9984200.1 TetR/AcrR family transcriptional regulator [Subtercola sp. RTI3]TIH37417.1 TetR/AcrR family transcriptional regulator [Subtercola vilae]